MRTEMTSAPASPGHSLKSGATKAVRDETVRVGTGQTKSAGAEGDDGEGDFSALLMTLSGDVASTVDVSSTPPSPAQDASVTDTGSEGKSPEASLMMPITDEATARVPGEPSALGQALGVDAALLAMPQMSAAGGLSGALNALTKGVSSVGPILGKVTNPLSGSVLSEVSGAMSVAPGQDKPTALPPGTTDADAFVSTAAVAQHASTSGAELGQRDSKIHMNPAQGHGVNWRSDASLVAESSELLKLSATALEGGAQKMVQKTPVAMDGGVWSAPSFQLTDNRMAGTPAPEVGSNAATATTVAQQVSYWIGRDVQSAELKLDGLGSSPVEVSISLHGREAHVEFRAEQLQTRRIIEEAMPQLKALLQSEGLELAGVSIGSSGAEASFSQAKQPQQSQRRGVARVAELGLIDAGGWARPGAGHALDLFV